ncbi:MAG: allose kinase [Lachnospiraceae bacterium]|nr:allose kinase [Lachnospiraceae bacterium]
MNIVGIDIGGTNFRIGLVNETGTLLKFEKVPVGTVFQSDQVLFSLAETIRSFCGEMAYDAVAIGFPATLDVAREKVVQAPNIPFMEDLPVKEFLSTELMVPVIAEKDVTFALCYDMEKYQIPEKGVVCGIYFGTGIGNAISIDGKPFIGTHGTAGELGHIPVVDCDRLCGCGNVGCLEMIAGGRALVEIRQEHYPEASMSEIFARHSEDVVIKEFVDSMAVAVATEVNILDPSYVLLGGGVLNNEGFPKEFFSERIRAKVRKPLPLKELNLVFTEDEREKCVLGAASYVRKIML